MSWRRASAPVCRISSQLLVRPVLPPTPWPPPYFHLSPSAVLTMPSGICSTRTLSHSTSSSSATIIGTVVRSPCPISGSLQPMTTVPSGLICMKKPSMRSPSSSYASAGRPITRLPAAPAPATSTWRRVKRCRSSRALMVFLPLRFRPRDEWPCEYEHRYRSGRCS